MATTNLANNSITNEKISDNAIGSSKIAPDSITSSDVKFIKYYEYPTGTNGWIPNGAYTDFTIVSADVTYHSVISLSILRGMAATPPTICSVWDQVNHVFSIKCNAAPPYGAILHFTVFNP